MAKIRVAIVGVGCCASSLVQGIRFYQNAEEEGFVPGLMHVRLGKYHVGDIEFSCAFDVDSNKVGKDLGEAIFTPINNTIKFCDVPKLGVSVFRGHTYDGLGKYYREVVTESPEKPVDIAKMNEAIKAGVGVVNCMPVFIASNPAWSKKFEQAGLPILGDDIKAQVGATITHRILAKMFSDRGVTLDRTSQLNFGGNMDFKNMLERERLESKKISKTGAVVSQLSHPIDPENIYIGPSDYVPWLQDRKWAHIRLEGREFGDVPVTIELKLEVWDSPNSAGVGIDAIRCCKLALDSKLAGSLEGPSSYFFKTPPVQYSDSEAHELVEQFIGQYSKMGHPAKVR
jgi:myo-inositol-1-phosphate synthase